MNEWDIRLRVGKVIETWKKVQEEMNIDIDQVQWSEFYNWYIKKSILLENVNQS